MRLSVILSHRINSFCLGALSSLRGLQEPSKSFESIWEPSGGSESLQEPLGAFVIHCNLLGAYKPEVIRLILGEFRSLWGVFRSPWESWGVFESLLESLSVFGSL